MSLLSLSHQKCSPRICHSLPQSSFAKKINTVTASRRYNHLFINHYREPAMKLPSSRYSYKIQRLVTNRFPPSRKRLMSSLLSHRCVVASLHPLQLLSRNFLDHQELERIQDFEEQMNMLAFSPIRKSFLQRFLYRIKTILKKLYDAIYILCRSSEIAIRVSPIILTSPFSIFSSRVNNMMWRYTLYSIQKLGPAFVKISQWAATRRDIFPPSLCDQLSTLHDANFLHSWKYTHKVLKEAVGKEYHLCIDGRQGQSCALDKPTLVLDPTQVIGSGSVAQVYKATLLSKSSKQDVAIKVLHPNIQTKIERDLNLMKRIAELLHSLPIKYLQMMNLPHVQENFAEVMRAQIDLQIESNHLLQFRENFDSDKEGKISFPKPIYANECVLVEEYVDSLPISAYMPHTNEDEDNELHRIRRKEIAAPLLRSFLKMVFMDNYIHSDLHNGNIKVRKTQIKTPTGKMKEKYTIVFLDCGIVTQLSENDRRNLRDLIKAVILNNGQEAGRLMVERAKYETCSQVEGGIEQFSKGVGEIVSDFHDRRKEGLTLGAVRIGALLARVLDLCRVHGVEIDPAMSNVVMSTLVLEGLGRSLDPDTNLFDVALPFVLGHGKV
ncbi:hypothetical protein CTEN210_11991 [Chaetoceros tenuissimus]|uniref:Protein kinase domain-containing protein n=1 Tax=Chaetoceros tenuissimus TaxID=426638 RepID=A0AAD3D2H4_9STRA|nr:hypothetical protein CTEN210_11991 [Chaetoceros tenuissimus]